jgi:hypothetical protein
VTTTDDQQLPDDDGPVIRPFADTLAQIQNGRLAAAAAEGLHELLEAVEDTGKGGSVTVTLQVAPLSKGDVRMLTVGGAVAVKAPKIEPAKSVLYLHKGNLQRDDPQKETLPGLQRINLAAPTVH